MEADFFNASVEGPESLTFGHHHSSKAYRYSFLGHSQYTVVPSEESSCQGRVVSSASFVTHEHAQRQNMLLMLPLLRLLLLLNFTAVLIHLTKQTLHALCMHSSCVCLF